MELYEIILEYASSKLETGSTLAPDPNKIIHDECYIALQKIKAIIEDDSLDDKQCFEKIEQIVLLFEELGSDGGPRHDFS